MVCTSILHHSRAAYRGSSPVYEAYEQGSPQFRLGLWKAVLDSPSYSKFFHESQLETFSRAIPTTVEGVEDRVCSKSFIAVQTEEEKAKIRKGIKEFLEKDNSRVWIDKEKGVFEFPYKTTIVLMRRK